MLGGSVAILTRSTAVKQQDTSTVAAQKPEKLQRGASLAKGKALGTVYESDGM